MKVNRICNTCQFYAPKESRKGYGDCRAIPPTRIGPAVTAFPEVKHDEWCGLHEVREELSSGNDAS